MCSYTINEKIIKGIELSAQEMRHAIKILRKIMDKGGVVVICEDDTMVTCYNYNSYSKKLAHKCRKH